tara:strand:- start:1268 stop:1633 length:366 start_codon:yes stop_codon:yes gene_type:complete
MLNKATLKFNLGKENYMKARNLFLSYVAVLAVCWSNVLFADNVLVDNTDQVESVQSEVIVNVNQADAETLASVLTGAGISRAQAIIAYRKKNGKFFSAEELSAVRGIGKSTIEKNAGRIVV